MASTSTIIILAILMPAGISAVITVTGHRGQSVQIKCPYKSGFETYTKYFCGGKCSWEDVLVQSGSTKDQRFSLEDNTAARVFTITITDLRAEDAGTYWCGIQRSFFFRDIYTEVRLQVKLDFSASTVTSHFPLSAETIYPQYIQTTEAAGGSNGSQSTPTLSINTTQSTQMPTSTDTSSVVLFVCVSLLVSIVAVSILVLFGKLYVPRSVASQRGSRRQVDRASDDPPVHHYSMTQNPVYQSGNPDASESDSDSAYQSVNTSFNLSDVLYTTVTPSTSQSEAVYQGVNPNTKKSKLANLSVNSTTSQTDSVYHNIKQCTDQSDSVYQSMIPNTRQSDSVYQSMIPNTRQSDSVYESMKPNTSQPDYVYQSLNPNTNQSNSVYQTLNLKNNQSDSVYQSLNPNTNQSDSVY